MILENSGIFLASKVRELNNWLINIVFYNLWL